MSKSGYLITGFVSGILFVVLAGAALVSSQMFVVNESKYDFNETVNKIEELSKANGWNISHIYNLQATMQKHNFEVEPVTVMSLCKPDLAYKILSSDNERPASTLMPCRVSIYKTKKGKVMISRMNIDMMSGMMTGITKEAMVMAGKENEDILKQVIK